jgi:hypothetical protein
MERCSPGIFVLSIPSLQPLYLLYCELLQINVRLALKLEIAVENEREGKEVIR